MMLFVMDLCGCSSEVERHVANVNVVGSTPITRFFQQNPTRETQGVSIDAA